jgi:hypothetical protein
VDAAAVKSVVMEVLDEQRKEHGDITDEEHYLHHVWLRDQIKSRKDIGIMIRESAIKWGVPAVLGGIIWALWQILKTKLAGGS